MSNYIRARSPEQKQERMDAIMQAADELFQKQPYHQITMGTIAEKLGWSRSNLYKYAATQEEIFLALHSAKNREWICDLVNRLDKAPLPTEQFARIWASTTDEHASFLKYQEIIIPIIESNVTLERLTQFKRDFAEMTEKIIEIISRQCNLDETAAAELYLSLLFQAPSLYNHYHCAELTLKAMRAAGLSAPSGSFVEAYTRFVALIIDHAASYNAQDA